MRMAGEIKTRIKEFLILSDELKKYKEAYAHHLHAQNYRLHFWAGLIAALAWLGFAFDLDPALHPEYTELFYMRLGLSTCGLAVMILSFFPKLRGKGSGLIYILAFYLAIVTPVFTARLAADAAYMSGYMLVLLLAILMPFSYRFMVVFIFSSLSVFTASFLYYQPELSANTMYSFQNLAIAVVIVLVMGFLFDRFRFQAFVDSRKVDEAHRELSKAHKQIQIELKMAADIQRGILPDLSQNWHGFRFTAYWNPLADVSGDFYDLIRMPNDSLGVLIADASGHGIPAALVTTMAKIAFNEYSRENTDPARIFYMANEQICRSIPGQEYLTAFLLRLEKNGTVTYGNASHQHVILLRSDGSTEILDSEGLFIGAIAHKKVVYRSAETRLDFGEKLILYTDGITEAVDSEGNEYGFDRLVNLLRENHRSDKDELQRILLEDFHSFIDSDRITDDITLFILERDESYRGFFDRVSEAGRLYDNEHYEDAIKIIKDLIKKYPGENSLLLLAGKATHRMKDYRAAADYLKLFTERVIDHYQAELILSYSLLKTGDYSQALKHADNAINLKRRSDRAHYVKSVAAYKTGDRATAAEHIRKALEFKPDNKRYQKLNSRFKA